MADIRITYSVSGKHEVAWRAHRLAWFNAHGAKTASGLSFVPSDVRDAAQEGPIGHLVLLRSTASPSEVRAFAKKVRGDGATDVSIRYRVQRRDLYGKWEACGDGALMIDSDVVPRYEEFAQSA